MNIFRKILFLFKDSEVQERSKDVLLALKDLIVVEDPTALAEITFAIVSAPGFIRDKLLFQNFEYYINEINNTSASDRAKFSAKLTENGMNDENPYRLLRAIERCDTKRKIKYLINASRAWSADFVDKETFFRICNAIVNCVEEDLQFLANNIMTDPEFIYSTTIQGLMNCGLAYQRVISGNADDTYKFTPFAEVLDRYALSFDKVDKYPMIGEDKMILPPKITSSEAVARFG